MCRPEPPSCTAEQLSTCAASLSTLAQCDEGERPEFTNCCPSCRYNPGPAPQACAARAQLTAAQRQAERAALDICAAGEVPQFNASACDFDCRPEERPLAECLRNNREAVADCLRNAPVCPLNAFREAFECALARAGGSGECCCACKPDLNSCSTSEEAVACRAAQRQCADNEVPAASDDEATCCASCHIGRPTCATECADGERCVWTFPEANLAERTPKCVRTVRRRVCLKAAGALKERIAAYDGDDLAEYIRKLITNYCAQSDSERCANPSRLANFLYNFYTETETDFANSLCFRAGIAAEADVEVTAATEKRAEESDEDLELMEEAMEDEYSKTSSGIEGADFDVEVSGASRHTFSVFVGAVALATLALVA